MSDDSIVFEQLRAALEEAGIRYAIGGSWASSAFGEPRFTNNVDILADVSANNVADFFNLLPKNFYADLDQAFNAIRFGRSFNIIEKESTLKFDIFPATSFPIGIVELERATLVGNTDLSMEPVPFVTPEDILLAKLHWYQVGGNNSENQWRDIQGIVRSQASSLDRDYLATSATILRVTDLLTKALAEAESF